MIDSLNVLDLDSLYPHLTELEKLLSENSEMSDFFIQTLIHFLYEVVQNEKFDSIDTFLHVFDLGMNLFNYSTISGLLLILPYFSRIKDLSVPFLMNVPRVNHTENLSISIHQGLCYLLNKKHGLVIFGDTIQKHSIQFSEDSILCVLDDGIYVYQPQNQSIDLIDLQTLSPSILLTFLVLLKLQYFRFFPQIIFFILFKKNQNQPYYLLRPKKHLRFNLKENSNNYFILPRNYML